MVNLERPVHPGEILKKDFLKEMNLSADNFADALFVSRTHIERILNGDLGLSADTACRLSKFFGTSPDFWLNLQLRYDLALAAKDKQLASDLLRIEPHMI